MKVLDVSGWFCCNNALLRLVEILWAGFARRAVDWLSAAGPQLLNLQLLDKSPGPRLAYKAYLEGQGT